jgi:hypothetical protein
MNLRNASIINSAAITKLSDNVEAKLQVFADVINELGNKLNAEKSNSATLFYRTYAVLMLHSKINLLQSHLMALKSMYESCNKHQLSHLAVPTSDLSVILSKHRAPLRNLGLELLYENIEFNYNVDKATCILINSEILNIEVQVPIKEVGTDYRVLSLDPLSFLYNSLRCKLVNEPVLMAYNGEIVVSLHGVKSFGHPKTFLLPRHQTQDRIPACALSLLKEEDPQLLVAECPLLCTNTSQTIVEPLAENFYSVLNPSANLHVICTGRVVRKLYNITQGRYEVTMPCNCNLQEENESSKLLIREERNCKLSAPQRVWVGNTWAGNSFSKLPIFVPPSSAAKRFENVTLPDLQLVTPTPLETGSGWTNMPLYKSGKVETTLFSVLCASVFAGFLYFIKTNIGLFACGGVVLRILRRCNGLGSCCRRQRAVHGVPEMTPATKHDLELGQRVSERVPRPAPRTPSLPALRVAYQSGTGPRRSLSMRLPGGREWMSDLGNVSTRARQSPSPSPPPSHRAAASARTHCELCP